MAPPDYHWLIKHEKIRVSKGRADLASDTMEHDPARRAYLTVFRESLSGRSAAVEMGEKGGWREVRRLGDGKDADRGDAPNGKRRGARGSRRGRGMGHEADRAVVVGGGIEVVVVERQLRSREEEREQGKDYEKRSGVGRFLRHRS
jgi:hypothetical protein